MVFEGRETEFRYTGLKRGRGIFGSIGGGVREIEIPVYGTQTRSSQALQSWQHWVISKVTLLYVLSAKIPKPLNDALDDAVKQTRRSIGHKIRKVSVGVAGNRHYAATCRGHWRVEHDPIRGRTARVACINKCYGQYANTSCIK